jgi:quinol monooxygenase YgiN
MSVIVVATITPAEGQFQAVLDAFTTIIPAVHEEPGCELYAAHTDGRIIVMVERWASPEALKVHADGENLVKLGAAIDKLLAVPTVVKALENVPAGDPAKGTIQ